MSPLKAIRLFNEGKACDAVISCIEAKVGRPRGSIHFPEQEHHLAPVEVTCQIGAHLYAFEHTGIEPFEQYTELGTKAHVHFGPIQDQVRGWLPPAGHFELRVPVKATLSLNGKNLQRMQNSISKWIRVIAPTLPIAQPGRRTIPIECGCLPDVPFKVSLTRLLARITPGELGIKHVLGGDQELQRVNRIRRAYNSKTGKLAAWQSQGARSVLILEENDMQLTDHCLVSQAVHLIEQTAERRPNEVYLLSTMMDAFWSLWALRIDDHVYQGLRVQGDSLPLEINPATLMNLTGR